MKKTNSNYYTNRIKVTPNVLNEISHTVSQFANIVGSTYGNNGKLVCFDGNESVYPTFTKDGVSVSRFIQFADPFDQMIIESIREIAERQYYQCGDGTTLSIILAAEILSHASKWIESGHNPDEIKRLIEREVNIVKDKILNMAIPADCHFLKCAIQIALNNDDELTNIVFDAVSHCGLYPSIVKDYSITGESRVVFEDGYQWDKGLVQEWFCNEPGKLRVTNPLVMVINDAVIHRDDVRFAVKRIIDHFVAINETGQPNIDTLPTLIVISHNFERDAMSYAYEQIMQKKIRIVWVQPSGANGTDERAYQMQNIAAFTGATMISGGGGIHPSQVKYEHLGTAELFFATASNSCFVGANNETVKSRIDYLEEIKREFTGKDPFQVQIINNSIARLQSKFTRIEIGGNSVAEMKERLDRVDDALKTAGIAKESGVVPGAGYALFNSRDGLEFLKEPIAKPYEIINSQLDKDELIVSGIVDPAKTIVSALENAASVVKMIICTECFLVKIPLEGE